MGSSNMKCIPYSVYHKYITIVITNKIQVIKDPHIGNKYHRTNYININTTYLKLSLRENVFSLKKSK
jgi:hypothetical protein